jgi:hypothetical protein
LDLNSWIPPPSRPQLHNQDVFLVLNFPNLAILVGRKMKIQDKCKQQTKLPKFDITNFKKKVTFNE